MGHPKIVGQKSYYTNFQQGIKLEKKAWRSQETTPPIYDKISVNNIDDSEQAILTIPHTTIVLSDNFLRDEKH